MKANKARETCIAMVNHYNPLRLSDVAVTRVTYIRRRGGQNRIMTTVSLPETVGEIAAQYPASIRVFEKHGIDFCCGGKRPLSTICQEKAADLEAVLNELTAEIAATPAADRDWQSAPINDLVDHILTTHHSYLKQQLPRIQAMLDKVAGKHTQHSDVLLPLQRVFTAMHEELDSHLMKEEMILFPAIRGAGASHCGGIENPIRVMLMEHDSAGEALAEIRRLTNDFEPPADACNTYRGLWFELGELEGDLHRHIHLENNILFPRVLA